MKINARILVRKGSEKLIPLGFDRRIKAILENAFLELVDHRHIDIRVSVIGITPTKKIPAGTRKKPSDAMLAS